MATSCGSSNCLLRMKPSPYFSSTPFPAACHKMTLTVSWPLTERVERPGPWSSGPARRLPRHPTHGRKHHFNDPPARPADPLWRARLPVVYIGGRPSRGRPRLLNVVECSYLQPCRQFNFSWKPAHFPGWPFGPLPARVRANEPSARTDIVQSRASTGGIKHGFRSARALLVEGWQSIENVRDRHDIYARQRRLCRTLPPIHPSHMIPSEVRHIAPWNARGRVLLALRHEQTSLVR
jgi:hypothetical protein